MERASQIAMTSSRNIEKSFNIMATAITGATTAAVGALGLLIDKTEDVVFSMQKMAQQSGVSMESFSKMAYAAKTAGLPVEDLSLILTRIAKSSFAAASGNKEAAAAYKQLAVNVFDANGHFKTADEIALDVAKSLNGFKDSAAKTGIEMMVMGRSGAQAAELMSVLANRFDETSAMAQKLGVVFSDQTAAGARQLHETLTELQEAGLGLSVRLLSQVSPALDQLAQKIVTLMSSTENVSKVEQIGQEIAHGVTMAGDALEFLVNHFKQIQEIVEALIAIRLGGMFGPMIASAAGASDIMAKLGIAGVNLTGNLLGIRRLGNVLAPVAAGARDYATALGGLAASEGAAATAGLALSDALAAIRGLMATLAATVPIATAASGAVYEFGMAIKSIADYEALSKDTGASWWEIQKAEAEEAGSSAENFYNWLKMIAGFRGASKTFYNDVDTILKSERPKTPWDNSRRIDMSKTVNESQTGTKKDLPPLGQEAKPDELAKKLADLKEKADAAQRALALVGAMPQAQRDSEILERYNEFLNEERFHLEQLTSSKRAAAEAAAHEAITTEINVEAATKYQQALYDLSQTAAQSIQEHLAMAAAVGKSAQAMQDAVIAAQVNQEMQRSGGPHWQDDANMRADADKRAAEIRSQLNAQNWAEDNRSTANTQLQIDAQGRLNDAILEGAEARRQAALENEKAAIRTDFHTRGDTDTGALNEQLAAAQRKSDVEKEAADLERANSFNILQNYRDQVQAIEDATAAAIAHGKAIDFHTVLAADKEAWIQYQDAQDKAILATGNMMDGLKVALSQMSRDTQSAADLMASAIEDAVHTMNDTLAQIMTEHHQRGTHQIRNQFSGAARGIGDDLAKKGLDKAESGLFGLGKADGSQSNPFWVRLTNGGLSSGASGATNELTDLLGHTSATSANAAGNAVGSVMGTAAKLLLPMFADGTDSTIPGMPSIVGERGPEVFIPPSAGSIVPNSKLRNGLGDTHNWQIDARGSNDPAQTVAIIDAYMKQAAPKISAATIKHMSETKARTPSSRGH